MGDESIIDSDVDPEYDPVVENQDASESDSDSSATAVTPPRRTEPPVATSTPTECRGSENEDANQLFQAAEPSCSNTRKRHRNVALWKKVKRSEDYNKGLSKQYKSHASRRAIGPRCGCKKKRCSTISDEERACIHKSFWALGKAILRQNFITGHCSKVPKKSTKLGSTRGDPINYCLTMNDGTRIQVCEKFFLSTLDLSKQSIHYNLKKSIHGTRQKANRPPPANKMSAVASESVRKHIKSISTVESHYCRAGVKRSYFEAGLSLPKLFDLYQASDYFTPDVKQSYYRSIFTGEFNIGFHQPRKDQCDSCDEYKKMEARSDSLDEEDVIKHTTHLRRAKAAFTSKENDKKVVSGTKTITFDLQQVLTAPRLFVGTAYYKRKLNCYNLTIFELQSKDGFCYFWHEGEGGRGTNEIASCVIKYLQALDDEGETTKVIMYSDTCGGQNRNKIFSSAILHFLTTSKNIITVEHKYFESGHSHMECDSMHSTIERAFKDKEVDMPINYIDFMKSARNKHPYKVNDNSSKASHIKHSTQFLHHLFLLYLL